MPFIAQVESCTVHVRDYNERRHSTLRCPECGDAMRYRAALVDPRRVAHFAHLPRPAGQRPTCVLALMSVEHLTAIDTLLKAAPRTFGVRRGGKEHYEFFQGKRRADVFFPADGARYPVVFEAQFSPIKFARSVDDPYTIEGRTDDYHAAGAHVVWCLPAKRRNLIATISRAYGCYGLLSDDGSEVEFVNTKALFLNQEPAAWLAGRIAWQRAQEAKRVEELYQAEQARRVRTEEEAARIYEGWRKESVAYREATSLRNALTALHRELDVPSPTAPQAVALDPWEASAHKAWKSGGSMGLGLWLAKTIRAREDRMYTVADYERWSERMREIETARPRITCVCCGRYNHQHDARLVLCRNCGDDLVAARAFVVTMVLKTESYLERSQDAALCAIGALDPPRQAWWQTFVDAQACDRPRADAAIAKAYQGDPDPFFAALRTWLIYQEVAGVYASRQQWAREMEEVLV